MLCGEGQISRIFSDNDLMEWLCPSSHQVLSSTLHQEVRWSRGSHWLKCHHSVPVTSSVQSPSPPRCCCSRVTEARILTPSFTPLYLQISNRDINHAASMVTPDQTCKQWMMMFRTESAMFGEVDYMTSVISLSRMLSHWIGHRQTSLTCLLQTSLSPITH